MQQCVAWWYIEGNSKNEMLGPTQHRPTHGKEPAAKPVGPSYDHCLIALDFPKCPSTPPPTKACKGTHLQREACCRAS
jgi:hypothetical protein